MFKVIINRFLPISTIQIENSLLVSSILTKFKPSKHLLNITKIFFCG